MLFPLRLIALGGAGLIFSFGSVEGTSDFQANIRKPAAVSYQGRGNCPELCSISGPTATNWTAYHNIDQLAQCQETVFYYMSIQDDLDNNDLQHRFYACTSYGAPQKPGAVLLADKTAVQTLDNASFTFGAWNESHISQSMTLSRLSMQMRLLLSSGYRASNNTPLILFAQTVSGTAGLYAGKSVVAKLTAPSALIAFENALQASSNVSIGGSAAMQLCGIASGYDGDHVFGFIATSNTSFSPVQQALQTWSNANCLSFDTLQNISGSASFTTPLVLASNSTPNGTITANSTSNSTSSYLGRRGDCSTIQVVSGDSCGGLASKCGISGAAFTTYNPSSTLCSTLAPGQHVCCSSGTLPNFSPLQNADGSCATYTIAAGDTCSGLAGRYSLTMDKINSYNANTWGWTGCNPLGLGNIICLSTGTAPFPPLMAGALCGPQMPGTIAPRDGTNISTLNPCPLNACCDFWGQCGVTAEFCTNTNTGPPGTAKPGTNGCISNCGTSVVQSGAPAQFISLAYYEAFGLDRPCLYQDVRQIDETKFSHIHFAFGMLDANYVVSMGDALSTYEFQNFRKLNNVHKVLSFGGWAFSTDPSTYSIFRNGVTAANRFALATSIANFINQNGMDGVDIDWEYPGEPDIPGIPAGSPDDGVNYLAFLVVLKNLLPGKTVSIAAPASYWYLKAFPIARISKVVDYIVYMTYDLHGQWDANNKWSQEGCSTGTCLRSHVNLTETMTSLAMITKAGVPSSKVVVGVSSYGRSFAMASAGCYGPDCLFTGTATQSNAAKGPCTQTAGYISDAEINEIIINNASRVDQNFLDPTSHSRIVVYDNTQWVALMDDSIRLVRQTLYKVLQMGGTTNWASDLETYNDVPQGTTSTSWDTFRLNIKVGTDPYAKGPRTGNWTTLTCNDPSVADLYDYTPAQRWSAMDAPDAWADIINVWKTYDRVHTNWHFTESVANTLHGSSDLANCGTTLSTGNCQATKACKDFEGGGSGAAAYEIWNSLVIINEMYSDYDIALTAAAALTINPALPNFELTFAPVPPPKSDVWLGILLSIVSLVGTVAVSGFFNSILKTLPSFTTDVGKINYDNLKDTSKALVSFSTSIAGNFKGDGKGGGWSIGSQAAYSDYMGQALTAWAKISDTALSDLFNGEDSSIILLTTLIENGKLIGGSSPIKDTAQNQTTLSDLSHNIAKAFFGYAITNVWPISETYAFILDSGYACNAAPKIKTLTSDVVKATGGCYNGKQYYLVYPSGSPSICTETCSNPTCTTTCVDNTFSMPPGVDHLDGSSWGGVTVTDIIAGSVRTYMANGNANGGAPTDPTNSGSLDDLINVDITTPGFIRLPVCSSDMAYTAWGSVLNRTTPNWPCAIKPSIDDCGSSTFIDQTSSASPSVSDCMVIVKNIQGTQGQWTLDNVLEKQSQIVQYGNCKFGIQGKKKNGNVNFLIGAQDIVDIITTAVQKFGGGGVVSAKGNMDCKGNVNTVPVEWGLY